MYWSGLKSTVPVSEITGEVIWYQKIEIKQRQNVKEKFKEDEGCREMRKYKGLQFMHTGEKYEG